MIRKTFTILVVCLLAGLQAVNVCLANETLIAVRKAYYEATGQKWAEASKKEKKRYLARFLAVEKQKNLNDKLKDMRADRKLEMKKREQDRELSNIKRQEYLAERQKMIDERNFKREKDLRERKLKRAEEKLKRARQRFEAMRNR